MLTQCARVNPLIKRFLCLLLCVSLLLPTLSFAEDTTGNVEWTNAVEHVSDEDEVFIFETGASVDAPGTVETDVFVDSSSEPEPSSEPLCSHENSERIPVGRGTETEWVYETEEYHIRSYEQMYHVVCAACGETLNETTEWQSEQAQHRFDEDGICKDCKWRSAPVVEESAAETPAPTVEPAEEPEEPAACEHQWQDCEESSEYTAWTAVDETQHSRAHKTALGRVCVTCGAVEHVSDSEETENAAHTFDANNVCTECGYQGAGAPEKAPSETEAPQETEAPEVTPEPETTPESEETSEPENTAVPEITPEPEISSEPDVTVEPENIVAPEITPEPEKTMAAGVQEGTPNEAEMQLLQGEDANAIMLLAAPSLELSGCQPEHRRTSFQVIDNYSDWNWWGSAQHLRTYDVREGVYCADCNLTFYTSTRQQQQILPHQFDKNTCKICGYLTTCTHPNTFDQIFDGGREGCQSIDENTHYVYTFEITRTYCSNCNAELRSTKKIVPKIESHSLNNNGTCWRCGYSPNCSHPNVRRNEDGYGADVRYEYVDAKQHRKIDSLGVYYFCPDCKFGWSGEVSDKEDIILENHNLQGGYCTACQHMEECAHENTTVTQQEVRSSAWKRENNMQHSSEYDVFEITACADCGEVLSKIPVDRIKKTESHSFWNVSSSCPFCGYTCIHDVTVKDTFMGDETYQQIENDAVYHYDTFNVYTRTICKICNNEINREITSHGEKAKQRHNFSDGDTCSLCGYKNACTHEQTGERILVIGASSWIKIDEKQHKYVYPAIITTYCLSCGEALKTEQVSEYSPWTRDHDFNKDNVCYYCGFENPNPCKHENTTATSWIDTGAPYTVIDENQHSAEQIVHIDINCSDCGVHLSTEKKQLGKTVLEDHNFNQNGECWGCGYVYVSSCSHKYTAKKTEHERQTWTSRYVNEEQHAIIYNLIEKTICTDCGMLLATETLQWNLEELEDHFGVEGIKDCSCGYLKKCAHEHTYIETSHDLGDDLMEFVDAKYHRIPYRTYSHPRCSDCGASLLQGEPKTEYFYVEHTFENGVCTGCGYQNQTPCQHEETYKGLEKAVNQRDYVHSDASSHTFTYDKAWEIICVKCGECIGEEALEIGLQGTEKHDFKVLQSGASKCRDCGYISVCQHEKTKEDNHFLKYTLVSEYDEQQHTVVSFYGYHAECLICGEPTGGGMPDTDETVTSPHTFNENGVCTVCSYRKASTAPTAAPTAAPTDRPTDEPTVRPTNTPTTVPTQRPTGYPIPLLTARPYWPAGGSYPTSTPQTSGSSSRRTAPKTSTAYAAQNAANADTAANTISLMQSEGARVEVMGAKGILTEAEYTALSALPATEQVLVTLIAAGYSDVAYGMMQAMGMTLSPEMTALVQQVAQRVHAMTQTERGALTETLEDLFLIEERPVGNAICVYLTLTLRICMGDVSASVSIDLNAVRNGDAA